MGDDHQKLQAGMRIPGIPHGIWNEMLDAIAWVKSQRNQTGGGRGQTWQNTGIVQMKNTTGAALDRFSVVGIATGASEIFPTPTNNLNAFKNVPYLYGETPDAAKHLGSFGVLQAPLGINKIGPAVVSGVTVCKLTMGGDTGDYADVIDASSASLGLLPGGSARILWVDSGTDPVWAVVKIGVGTELVAFQIDGAYTNATVLDCAVGVWNSSTHNYGYTGAAAKCIDRRANVPVADDDATGVGYWMPSDTHGSIIFIVDLDCPA